ncbi:MAG: tetratricopeptide repeat protein [Kofleriaceae bacterium]
MRLQVVIGALLFASVAFADDPKTTADEKFAAASKLRDAGKTQEACAMFDESLELNPNAIGTILNVARCAEEEGKVATAIRYFSDARDRAREQNLAPQLSAAEDHLAKLIPRQSHLAITFAETYPADAKLVVAGRVVDFSAANDIVVDPGPTEVVVSAPGRVPYSSTVQVPESQHKALAVPKLGYPVTTCSSCRTIGKVGVAIGAAAVVTSVVLGFKSHSDWKDAVKSCTGTGTPVCPPDQVNLVTDARTLGNVGTVVGIAGGVLAIGGAALWYFSPHADSREHLAIIPMVSPTEAGFAAFARF